ncbi:MAG TPA: LysR family transcriptional regulator, partial [Thermomicrobiales bacterium]|nr:LysR family transcriptional regulator [Thermomicrobiales bacterium]
MVELRQLRYFVAVAEELHFTRAAERLGMAQPPLSQQIRGLERELGVELFRRTKRRVELTEPGRVLLDSARRTLAEAATTVHDVQRAARGEVGRLAVGFVGAAVADVLPRILRHYTDGFPDVELDLRQCSTAEQVDRLRDGALHVGFLRPPIHEPALETQVVARERLLVVVPVRHRLAKRESVDLRELAGERFILFPRSQGPGSHDRIIRLCHEAGFVPEIGQEAVEMQTIVGLVAARLGVSIVPDSVRHLRTEGVRYLPLEGRTPTWDLAVAH